jgi:hypothetical protein
LCASWQFLPPHGTASGVVSDVLLSVLGYRPARYPEPLLMTSWTALKKEIEDWDDVAFGYRVLQNENGTDTRLVHPGVKEWNGTFVAYRAGDKTLVGYTDDAYRKF